MGMTQSCIQYSITTFGLLRKKPPDVPAKTSYILALLNLSLRTDRLTCDAAVLIPVFAVLRGVMRSRVALHLEVLALRHQRQVLERSRPRRVRLAKADRWL